jgi:hypothetical protein
MAWFVKYYRHEECKAEWTDEWSCACNDSCPVCGDEIEPYDWDDLSVVVSSGENGGWIVCVSPPNAEHAPDYTESHFEQKWEAEDFARRETGRLERA